MVDIPDDQFQQLQQYVQHSVPIVQQAQGISAEQQRINQQTLSEIVARGRKEYGREAWDGAMQSLTRRNGGDISAYEAQLLANPRYAHRHAWRMAGDPDYERQFKDASYMRRTGMILEDAVANAPHGYIDDTPPPKSADEFRRNGGRGIDDDQEWSRHFDKVYGTRRRPG